MRFTRIVLIFLSIVVVLMLSSCSSSEEPEKKGAIKQTTDKIANKAIDYIKTPIDQAKMAKELTEQHNKTIEKAVKNQ